MMDKCRESRKPQLIHKGKLSKTCINGLNKSNIDKVNVQDILECSICIEKIELEKYKIKKNNLVFLNCSHVYHTKCIQSWVKTQINQINKPNCPLCRDIIINIENKIYSDTESDNSDFSYYND